MDKTALHTLSYGLYVVGSRLDDRVNGQIANAVFQVTSEPPVIAVCINRENYTHKFISESGVLSVSILVEETPMELIGRFGFKSGREVDKFADFTYRRGVTGAPLLLDSSIAFLEGEVNGQMELGTHTLFCARLVDCGTITEGAPLTYAYYHAVKKGRSPKSAPTYVETAEGETRETDRPGAAAQADKYRCLICGYIYDPVLGDPDAGITAGTPFQELPETWVCPICGASKDEFEKEA